MGDCANRKEYQQKYHKAWYERLKAEGRCVLCQEPLNGDPHCYCKNCREYLSKRQKEYRARKAADRAADIVKVVRCKDCKHYRDWKNGNITCAFWTFQWDMPTEPDGFCSYGERREDA